MAKVKVLIVGAGFAGTKAALDLADDDRFDVSLLSNSDHFTYFPTLYHVATGSPKTNAAIPLKTILDGKDITLIRGQATTLDRKAKTITTDDNKTYSYDTLILALGVVTNYFNIPGLAELSYGVKSIDEIETLKKHLHDQIVSKHQPDLNYVVVGGGPTGVELAGTLGLYLKHVMQRHNIEQRAIHIDLVEALPRLLANMPKDVGRMVARRLKRRGVKLYLNQKVEGETANDLVINDKPLQSHTVIWTAGTANNPFFAANKFATTANHKVATDVFLQAEPDIFVLGDNANTPFSGLAQTAVHDGKYVAANLKRRASGKHMKSYSVHYPITVIPIGEGWAAVVRGNIHIYGWIGWVLRQAADIRAFHDFEPWSKSINQWFSYTDSEEACPICLNPN